MIRRALLLATLLIVVSVAAVHAQDDEVAHVRVIYGSGPPVLLYLDDTAYGGDLWGDEMFKSGWIHPFVEYPVGQYDLAIVTEEGDLEGAPVESISLHADHRYSLIIYETDPIRFLWIDETATLNGHDPEEEALYILVNLIEGVPPISVNMQGETTLADLAYGEFALGIDPPGPVEGGVQILTEDGEVVFDWPDVEDFIPGVYFLQIYYGAYPGHAFTDYYPLSIADYAGELTITSGRSLVLGETLEGQISGVGERVHHALKLADDTTLDIELKRTTPATYSFSGGMALRIYTATGEVRYKNDGDKDMTYVLPAGDYVLEVGTTGDIETADYTLTVLAE